MTFLDTWRRTITEVCVRVGYRRFELVSVVLLSIGCNLLTAILENQGGLAVACVVVGGGSIVGAGALLFLMAGCYQRINEQARDYRYAHIRSMGETIPDGTRATVVAALRGLELSAVEIDFALSRSADEWHRQILCLIGSLMLLLVGGLGLVGYGFARPRPLDGIAHASNAPAVADSKVTMPPSDNP